MEIANVVAVTRSTFTPSTRAAPGFSATARIERPSAERLTRIVSPIISPSDTATMTICSTLAVTPAPNSIASSGTVPTGKRRVFGPNTACSSAMIMPPMAMDEISPAKCASGRSFSGRKAIRSISRPRIAPKANTMTSTRAMGRSNDSVSQMPTNAEAAKAAG